MKTNAFTARLAEVGATIGFAPRDGARARRDVLFAEAIAAVDATGLGAAGETLRQVARFVAAQRS